MTSFRVVHFRESLIHLTMAMSYVQSIVLEFLVERDLDLYAKLNMVRQENIDCVPWTMQQGI